MSAYLIIQARLRDRKKFIKYTEVVPKLVEQFGGQYMAIDSSPICLESSGFESNLSEQVSLVVSHWPDKEQAQKFWDSHEYQEAKRLREDCGDFHVMLVDGLPSFSVPFASKKSKEP